jgi:hypothetical protein
VRHGPYFDTPLRLAARVRIAAAAALLIASWTSAAARAASAVARCPCRRPRLTYALT